ncbi:hypothetical protein QQS21_004384 [Conoideocrella luteorostrata]|uniref:Enoyl reductase (ER) domain-containing protein n=1 Tax=Conoideocrella luteorostrata TaxID=1105319 RepID=A0AAJ0G1L9_9HYPO|nr:hypothetical protein QQS21_004384 [Conoideocrella luteorostrata]
MTLQEIPSSQRVIQQGEDGKLYLVDGAAVPALPPGYVLVKTSAVALNPSDNKIATRFPILGARVGTDFCGTVSRVADGDCTAASLRPGDVVCGAAFCFAAEHRLVNGAFAEYVRTHASLLLRPPLATTAYEHVRGAMNPAEAATLGTAIATCIMAFWSHDALGLAGTPDDPLVSEKPVYVLVYGGSTATGTIATQLLKLSGYEPIAICSPHNFVMVQRRGASVVLDYASPDVVGEIKTQTGDRLKYALDCISDGASVATCYEAIQRPGGRYASLEHVPDAQIAKRRAITAKFVLAAEMFGLDIKLGDAVYDRPGDPEKLALGLRYMPVIQRLLDSAKLQVHPVDIVRNGLEGVVDGMHALAAGKVSGKELVVVIDGNCS